MALNRTCEHCGGFLRILRKKANLLVMRCTKCKAMPRRTATPEELAAERQVCPKCGESFPIKGFGSHCVACDGLGGIQKERKRRKRLKQNMTPEEWEHEKALGRASYQRHKLRIGAALRERYRTDPEYREKQKRYSRTFYDCPERFERGRALRKQAYRKDPDRFKAQAKKWRSAHYERATKREAERRASNRERNRAHARLQSALLTDSYVRNQLSKYSTKSTNTWTEAEVSAKREAMLHNRSKRITHEKATAMRTLYNAGKRTALQLANDFNVSVSSVFLLLNNALHYDPDYEMARIRNPTQLAKALKLISGSAELAALYGNK